MRHYKMKISLIKGIDALNIPAFQWNMIHMPQSKWQVNKYNNDNWWKMVKYKICKEPPSLYSLINHDSLLVTKICKTPMKNYQGKQEQNITT